MKRRYIVVGADTNHTVNQAFRDVIDGYTADAVWLRLHKYKSRLLNSLYRFCYHPKTRKFTQFIPSSVWNWRSELLNLKIAEDETVYIIFALGRDVEQFYDKALFKKIKDKYGKKVCAALLLFDSLQVTQDYHGWNRVRDYFPYFDIVATFDEKDARERGIQHFYDPYPKRDIIADENQKTDLFFVGVDKGRANLLEKIAAKAEENGLSCAFDVFGLQDETCRHLNAIKKTIPYNEVLKRAVSAKCLVEILAEGQSSSSFRYYEAVVYNKMLLTNNPNITNMPFYNPEYMMYFSDAEEIDFQKIKKELNVQYHYQDEFSIERLFYKVSCIYEGRSELE